MLETIGYISAILTGGVLGIIGAGGSILILPILVFLFGIPPVLASGYSLLIVGLTALLGGYTYYKQKLVDYKIFFIFGIPSIIAVHITRKYILPGIPDSFLIGGDIVILKDQFLMILFALFMLLASWAMIRKGRSGLHEKRGVQEGGSWYYSVVLAEGLLVGMVTGLIGAGGGFLIIPTLIFFGGLSMKVAVGTSLFIIAAKSLIGFIPDVHTVFEYQDLLLGVLVCMSAGMFIGTKLSGRIPEHVLKRVFGYVTIVLAIVILVQSM